MGILKWSFLVFLAGCFSPALDGHFTCGPGNSCPPGLTCIDGICGDGADLSGVKPTDAAVSPVDMATKPVDMSMSGCTPATCAPNECGTALDGCGGQIKCMTPCGLGTTCGANQIANKCGFGGCQATTCKAGKYDCGLISDGCANVLNCGTCMPGKTCGAKTPNMCD